jgi:hypothetical protein
MDDISTPIPARLDLHLFTAEYPNTEGYYPG